MELRISADSTRRTAMYVVYYRVTTLHNVWTKLAQCVSPVVEVAKLAMFELLKRIDSWHIQLLLLWKKSEDNTLASNVTFNKAALK